MMGLVTSKGFGRKIDRVRSVQSFVRKQIEKWSMKSGVDPARMDDARYQVVFEKEGEGHVVRCRVEIAYRGENGVSVVRSARSAPGLHQALVQCLAVMRPRQLALASA